MRKNFPSKTFPRRIVSTMFVKGMKRPAGSGRRKGSVTKLTLLARHKLEELGCDPIAEMVAIAKDENTPIEIRAKLLCELSSYCYPKLKATEHTGAGGGPIELHETGARDLLMERIEHLAVNLRGDGNHAHGTPIVAGTHRGERPAA